MFVVVMTKPNKPISGDENRPFAQTAGRKRKMDGKKKTGWDAMQHLCPKTDFGLAN